MILGDAEWEIVKLLTRNLDSIVFNGSQESTIYTVKDILDGVGDVRDNLNLVIERVEGRTG